MLNENNLILLDNARSALTEEKNTALVKESYAFINTAEIVSRFERQGWLLSNARQAKVKNQARQGYQKHLLQFRNSAYSRINGLDDNNASIPELIVENSHDGTAALKIYFGVFRIACLNGLIAGSNFSSFRVIHSQNSVKRIDESIDMMTDSIPGLIGKVEKYSKIELNGNTQLLLAEKMTALRLENTKHVEKIDLQRALNPRRLTDTDTDAYSVFNVLQEKVIRGGISFQQVNPLTNELTWKNTRPITSVSQSVKLNRSMWDSLEEVVNAVS